MLHSALLLVCLLGTTATAAEDLKLKTLSLPGFLSILTGILPPGTSTISTSSTATHVSPSSIISASSVVSKSTAKSTGISSVLTASRSFVTAVSSKPTGVSTAASSSKGALSVSPSSSAPSARSSATTPSSQASSAVPSSSKGASSAASRSINGSSGGLASTGGRASSGASSSGSGGNLAPSRSGCPSITTSTKTLTYTTLIPTTYTTEPVATYYAYTTTTSVTSTGTISYTQDVAGSNYTSFYTTSTEYYFVDLPAQTTVTVPTPSGFTPIRCQAEYSNPTITITATSYGLGYVDPPPTTITVTTPLTDYNISIVQQVTTVTITNSTNTFYRASTVSSTITRSSVTTTVYDACATLNVTPDYPGGKFPYIGVTDNDADRSGNAPTNATIVLASDPVDCCANCQANPLCVASSYANTDFFNSSSYKACTLYLKPPSNATCDLSFIGARIDYSWTEKIVNVSNGPCGHYGVLWTGDSLY